MTFRHSLSGCAATLRLFEISAPLRQHPSIRLILTNLFYLIVIFGLLLVSPSENKEISHYSYLEQMVE